MSRYRIPERPVDPPEDKRRYAFSCAICEGDILEGDDYFDVPGLGPCCESCIADAKRHDAEAEDNSDFLYDSAREEALIND